MADINATISLGIGSPAGIQEFLTFGLQQEIGSSAVNFATVDWTHNESLVHYTIPPELAHWTFET